MIYDYKLLYNSINIAIEDHLLATGIQPTAAEVSVLASEITRIVFAELNKFNLNEETIDTLSKTTTRAVAAQGQT